MPTRNWRPCPSATGIERTKERNQHSSAYYEFGKGIAAEVSAAPGQNQRLAELEMERCSDACKPKNSRSSRLQKLQSQYLTVHKSKRAP